MAMAGSSRDVFGQVAALLDGTIDLCQFQEWFASAAVAIEVQGSDDDIALSNFVMNLLAEYTGDHIRGPDLLRALSEAPGRTAAAPGISTAA
jgi:hypothetical protein